MITVTTGTAPENDSAHYDFLTYPLHKLVSVFDSEEKMESAVDELKSNGFSDDVIEAFCGVAGEHRMDFSGVEHGFWTSILRNVQHVGPDRIYLDRYERHLHDGHCMVMVSVTNQVRKERAARILHHHTNERVTYFGLLSANEVK